MLLAAALTLFGRCQAFLVRGGPAATLLRAQPVRGPLHGAGVVLRAAGEASALDELVDVPLGAAKQLLDSEPGQRVSGLFGEERFESVKASVLATVFGAIPLVPASLADSERLTPRWEFQLDMLALDIALFGLVYRYAVREGDDNPMLKMGVLSAFVLPRALFLVQLPAECSALPLACGEPLGYFSWVMLAQVAWQLFVGGVALGGALYGLERAFDVGLLRRFSGQSVAPAPEPSAKEGFRLPWDP